MKMTISTPYGDRYEIDLETGNVNGSPTWKFVAFCTAQYGRKLLTLEQIRNNPNIVKTLQCKYKNGNPRITWIDKDHGTTRIHGNTRVHGISSAYVQ